MFKFNQSGNIKFVTIEEFENTGLVNHAFSTRIGGVSTGEAATMNFGFNRKDTLENITENFRLLCNVIGEDYTKTVISNQVHDNKVYVVTEKDMGKGLVRESDIKGIDALVTNVCGIPICTFHADCMPIFILDPVKKAIGAVHSGWKSTALNISRETIEVMKANYGTNPADLLCGIGPSIGPCHFEVDKDVANLFDTKFVDKHDKPHVNLWKVARSQLLGCGVLDKNIIMSDICTFCNNDVFYSYRGDNHKTGSMVSIISLRG